jgi:hypothetical protein
LTPGDFAVVHRKWRLTGGKASGFELLFSYTESRQNPILDGLCLF